MKIISLEHAVLDDCVEEAQHERLVITRDGKPVALIIGLEGWDEEQIRLGGSEEFWKLIAERRSQKAIDREELERRLGN